MKLLSGLPGNYVHMLSVPNATCLNQIGIKLPCAVKTDLFYSSKDRFYTQFIIRMSKIDLEMT